MNLKEASTDDDDESEGGSDSGMDEIVGNGKPTPRARAKGKGKAPAKPRKNAKRRWVFNYTMKEGQAYKDYFNPNSEVVRRILKIPELVRASLRLSFSVVVWARGHD